MSSQDRQPVDDARLAELQRLSDEATPGAVQVYRDDERYCTWTRHGFAHEPHEWRYAYTRPEHLGGITHGGYYCDGLGLDEQPWPESPLLAELSRLRAAQEGLDALPLMLFAGANRYATDDTHVLHLWTQDGRSFDVMWPR